MTPALPPDWIHGAAFLFPSARVGGVSHTDAARNHFRVERLPRRARVLDGSDVVSEVIDHPGATDTLFDVLAACIAALSPGPRVAMLGFAAGGVVAPLRATGFDAPLRAVDLSLDNVALFRELSQAWCGDVRVDCADAVSWLRASRRRFDCILEDLAISSPRDAVKPAVSLHTLPELVARRVRRHGIVVNNMLPVPGRAWNAVLQRIAAPFDRACVLHMDDYVNRILVTGALPDTREVARRVRDALASIGSTQTQRFSVRTLPR